MATARLAGHRRTSRVRSFRQGLSYTVPAVHSRAMTQSERIIARAHQLAAKGRYREAGKLLRLSQEAIYVFHKISDVAIPSNGGEA